MMTNKSNKHLKIAKFVLMKEEMQHIKGGNLPISPINCVCHTTQNSGCINGTGSGIY